MPVPNPLFNAEWEAIYNHHRAEVERLETVINEKYKQDKPDEGLSDLIKQRDENQSAVYDTYIMRHPTVQDYAKWMFRNFDFFQADTAGHAIPSIIIDYEAFQTLEEVREAWNDRRETAKQAIAEKTRSLPVSDKIRAFKNDREGQILSYWRGFSEGELSLYGDNQKLSVRTLVTATEMDGKLHVCFMHDYTHNGASVMNSIEGLASAVYREALLPHGDQKQIEDSQKGAFKNASIQPSDLHFYIHVPPSEHLRETFIKVDMDFANGRFNNPNWDHLKEIPMIIQSARYRVAKDVVASNRQALTRDGGPN